MPEPPQVMRETTHRPGVWINGPLRSAHRIPHTPQARRAAPIAGNQLIISRLSSRRAISGQPSTQSIQARSVMGERESFGYPIDADSGSGFAGRDGRNRALVLAACHCLGRWWQGCSHYCYREAVVAARVDGSPAEAFIEGLGTRPALGVEI